MIHVKKSKIAFSSNPANIESTDIFAKFKNNNWSKPMKPITTNSTNNSSLLQTMQKTEPKADSHQSTSNIEQDTFVKKDKNKIAKKVAIGTSLALVAYSAFALIKHKSVAGSKEILPRLAEPIKVLAARINPNGFKPSVAIEENETAYVGEVFTHISRLAKRQQNAYVNQLYEKSTFTETGKKTFIHYFRKFINQ